MNAGSAVKFFLASAAIIAIASSPKAFSKDFKAGVVDVEKVYSSYEKVKQSTSDLQSERKPKQEQYDRMIEEIKKMEDDYKAKASKMTLSERKSTESKIKAKKLEAQSFLEETNATLLEKNRAITQQRLKEISDTIQEYAKANNFDVVFDKKNLPYFSSTIDITDAIIAKLNKK
ncbi:MAG: OmpH family outer membrane protein [Candidatus Omnitrophica bacterium]|nr:OmpH family outer membrane protein [Candidatus Omnitrophota bacterium]MCM8828614.1 OmpH family outer membrane protein [Candidatus Omnitrophota bacterium]